MNYDLLATGPSTAYAQVEAVGCEGDGIRAGPSSSSSAAARRSRQILAGFTVNRQCTLSPAASPLLRRRFSAGGRGGRGRVDGVDVGMDVGQPRDNGGETYCGSAQRRSRIQLNTVPSHPDSHFNGAAKLRHQAVPLCGGVKLYRLTAERAEHFSISPAVACVAPFSASRHPTTPRPHTRNVPPGSHLVLAHACHQLTIFGHHMGSCRSAHGHGPALMPQTSGRWHHSLILVNRSSPHPPTGQAGHGRPPDSGNCGHAVYLSPRARNRTRPRARAAQPRLTPSQPF